MAVELVAEHVRVQPDRMGARADGEGEVTAFEPPWLVGYRLSAGPRTVWLRATCTAAAGGTRIHLHQAGGPRGKAIIRL